MIWQASLVSSVLVALTFGALWLLRKASSDRRRTTCICAILGCIATWLMAFAPSGWLPQLHAPGVAGVSSAIEQRAQPVIERLTSAQPLPVVAAIHREGPPPKVIDWAAVYGVGVAAVLIVWFGGWAFSVRLVAKGQDAEHLQAQPGWRTCVVPSLRVPASLGWPCPSILLPKDALDWNAETLDVVLRHEASHLQRRDHAWIGLANLLCAAVGKQPPR